MTGTRARGLVWLGLAGFLFLVVLVLAPVLGSIGVPPDIWYGMFAVFCLVGVGCVVSVLLAVWFFLRKPRT